MHVLAFGLVGILALIIYLRGVVPVTAGNGVDFDVPTLREVGLVLLFGVLVAIAGAIAMGIGL